MSKISQYSALTTPAAGDLLPIVDVDNLAMAPSGTTMSITIAELLGTAGVGLTPQATTGNAGFALQNGTPNILTWTAPADGNMHRFTVFSLLHCTSAETGGLVQVGYFGPFAGASMHVATLFNAGLGTDTTGQAPANAFDALVGPGTAVTITQTSALTAGAATVWAEIWGS